MVVLVDMATKCKNADLSSDYGTIMRIHTLLALIFVLLLPDAAAAQAKLTPEKVAENINNFYKTTKDFQAKFEQVYSDVAAGEEKRSYGRVYFKTPGKMRWDYYAGKNSKKRDKIYVSDGSIFWIYEPEFQQVFKQCLGESQLPTSLRFLMGQGDLLKEFDVSFAKKSTDATPILRLVPKKPTAKYKELEFTVDPKSYQVVRTKIFDPYGNTNTIVFNSGLVNRNLPDRGFDFKVPKGAREINPQKSCP